MAESLGRMKIPSDSTEINVEKRALSLGSVMSIFLFIVAIFILVGPLLGDGQDQSRQVAIGKAQSLAYQIADLDAKNSLKIHSESDSSPRSPASVESLESTGNLGLDPWGQAYHYKIRHEGRQKIIDVWSSGEHAIQTQVLIPTEAL